MEAFKQKLGKPNSIWFDKTPQNIYGIDSIASDFPTARFIHMVRHPVNVVTSLLIGRVMKVDSLHEATDCWLDAVRLIKETRDILNDRLIEVRYEELTRKPRRTVRKICKFIGIRYMDLSFDYSGIYREQNQYASFLTPEQVSNINRLCLSELLHYGYSKAG